MNSKFDRLFNTIMEDVKSSKIKAKKVIKEDNDDYVEDWHSEMQNMLIMISDAEANTEAAGNWNNVDWAEELIEYLNSNNIHSKKEGYAYIDKKIEDQLEDVKHYDDMDDQEEDYDYPTITIGDLREELQKADPNDTIYFGWTTYSDGGEDCCGFNYDEDSNAFYLNQFTFIPEDDEDQDAENTEAPTAQEVLNAIESLSDDVKVFGYWDDNEGARYCINKIVGTYIELDGSTEC